MPETPDHPFFTQQVYGWTRQQCADFLKGQAVEGRSSLVTHRQLLKACVVCCIEEHGPVPGMRLDTTAPGAIGALARFISPYSPLTAQDLKDILDHRKVKVRSQGKDALLSQVCEDDLGPAGPQRPVYLARHEGLRRQVTEQSLRDLLQGRTKPARLRDLTVYMLEWAREDWDCARDAREVAVLEDRRRWIERLEGLVKHAPFDRNLLKDTAKGLADVRRQLGAHLRLTLGRRDPEEDPGAGGSDPVDALAEQFAGLFLMPQHATADCLAFYRPGKAPPTAPATAGPAPAPARHDTGVLEAAVQAQLRLAPGDDGALLRLPQREALLGLSRHFADPAAAADEDAARGDVLADELDCVGRFRGRFGALVRQSYVGFADGEARDNEEAVCARSLRDLLRAQGLARPPAEPRTALVELPTGCGKTGVLTLAPFLPGLRRKQRCLLLSPSLTILVELARNLSGKGGKGGKNFFLRHGFLPETQSEELPRCAVLSSDADLAVSLEHGAQFKAVSLQLEAERVLRELAACRVVLCNWQALFESKLWTHLRDRKFFDLLFIDEAHHSAAQGYRRVREYFADADICLVTATPYRGDDQPLDAECVYRYGVRSAIAARLIKHPVWAPVPASRVTVKDKVTGSVVEYGTNDPALYTRGIVNSARLSGVCRRSTMQACMDRLRKLRALSGAHHQAIALAAGMTRSPPARPAWVS